MKKVKIEITDYFISVNQGKNEIVGWHVDEWKEDPSIVPSIANAIKMAYEDIDSLKSLLNKY